MVSLASTRNAAVLNVVVFPADPQSDRVEKLTRELLGIAEPFCATSVPKLIVVPPAYEFVPARRSSFCAPITALPVAGPPSVRAQPLSMRPPAPLMLPRICQFALVTNVLSRVAPTPVKTQLRVAGDGPAPPVSEVRFAVVPTPAPLVVFSTAPPATVIVPVAAPKAASFDPLGQRNNPASTIQPDRFVLLNGRNSP